MRSPGPLGEDRSASHFKERQREGLWQVPLHKSVIRGGDFLTAGTQEQALSWFEGNGNLGNTEI